MAFDIFLIVLLIGINGFFVAAEFAIVKVRSTQIETLIQSDNRRARVAKEIISHMDTYLSAAQLGITMASIALGWVGEPVLSKLMAPLIDFAGVTNPQAVHALSFALGFSIITFLHITVGEQAPKCAAIQYSKAATMSIAYPLKIFYTVFKPFIWIINVSSNLLLKMIGIQPVSENELSHSEEEIRLLIAGGRKSGVIDATEYKLIENIFDFTETTAKEIMVPRTQMFALDMDKSFDENFKLAVDSGFTRIPVFRETVDTLVGILYVKDLFKLDRNAEQDLGRILRPVYFVPETTSISRLMHDFQHQKIHMGIVIDEFGGTSGLITLENILEKIVGQIQDEYDEEKKEYEIHPDGSFTVDAKMRIDAFNEQFQTDLPADRDYETLAGFLNEKAGRIPNLSEEIRHGNISFKIIKKSPKQVQQVKVVKLNLS